MWLNNIYLDLSSLNSTVCSSHNNKDQTGFRWHVWSLSFCALHFDEDSADSLDDNPMQQRLPAPERMLVSLKLVANTYNHSRVRLVMSHKSVITSSSALEVIKFPFLLCVPLLTNSRWGLSCSINKRWGREACHCLQIRVPVLIACGQAWLLCLKHIAEGLCFTRLALGVSDNDLRSYADKLCVLFHINPFCHVFMNKVF